VNSELTDDFLACFRRLPERIRRLARKNYKTWKANPERPGIEFKLVGKNRRFIPFGWGLAGERSGSSNATPCCGSGSGRTRSTTGCSNNFENRYS